MAADGSDAEPANGTISPSQIERLIQFGDASDMYSNPYYLS